VITWQRFFGRVLHAWAALTLDLIDLVIGLGDLPDSRPAMPDPIDWEYFELIEQEGRP
jgi:hypothetical protein